MSVTSLLRREVIESDVRDAIAFVVEKGLYKWITGVQDQLSRQVSRNELSGAQASKIEDLRLKCYWCCQRALKEGRLPL